MLRSNSRISIWIFNLAFGEEERANLSSAGLLFVCFCLGDLWSLFSFFGSLKRYYFSNKYKRHAGTECVGCWVIFTVSSFMSKCVKLSAVSPINCPYRGLAGPARRVGHPSRLLQNMIEVIVFLVSKPGNVVWSPCDSRIMTRATCVCVDA